MVKSKVFMTPVGMFKVESKREILDFLKSRHPEVKQKDIVEVIGELPENEKLIVLRTFLNREFQMKQVQERVDLCMKDTIPSRKFEIGELVLYGNFSGMRVSEIHDNYKFYTISHGEVERFALWTEIEKYRSSETNKKFPIISDLNVRLKLNFGNSSIDSLFSYFYTFGLDMDPPYQRGLEWSNEDKELLIDSILKDLDIGKFVFVRNSYTPGGAGYTVLDGKQRLSAIRDFYEDRFTYKGRKYSELSFQDKIVFKTKGIQYAHLDGESLTERDIVQYFLRLNQGGVVVSKEHLKAIADKYDVN